MSFHMQIKDFHQRIWKNGSAGIPEWQRNVHFTKAIKNTQSHECINESALLQLVLASHPTVVNATNMSGNDMSWDLLVYADVVEHRGAKCCCTRVTVTQADTTFNRAEGSTCDPPTVVKLPATREIHPGSVGFFFVFSSPTQKEIRAAA